MAWRRPVTPPRVEAPAWYRNYDPASWDEPDGHELSMMAGCDRYRCWPDAEEWAPGWPVFIHDQHARRRWHEAQGAYRQAHPLLAEQEFAEITAGRAERRREL